MSEKNESRDWELSCDNCNGSGHVFVERQVAERKTDVQEFKEECECCEGRGFTIAFEDIPGIAEYVRKTRPAPSAPGDAQDERQAFEAWAKGKKMPLARIGEQYDDFWVDHAWNGWQARAALAAPAAGDALDLLRLRRIAWLIGSIFVHGDFKAETVNERELEKLLRENGTFWDSLAQFDAALAAQVPQQGEA